MKVRLSKVIGDFFANWSKAKLVVLAVFLGMLITSVILNSYVLLDREMARSYDKTNPAAFMLRVLTTDRQLLDDTMEKLTKQSDIEQIEKRQMLRGRIGTKEQEWISAELYVIDDFNNVKINQFYNLEGHAEAQQGEILLDHFSAKLANVEVGSVVNTKIPLFPQKELTVAGIVQDTGLKPAWMETKVYGYISQETLDQLGQGTDGIDLLFEIAGDRTDTASVRNIAIYAKQTIEDAGIPVNKMEIPQNGEHPNAAQMNAVLFLLEIFGLLALILSFTLIYNLFSAIMSEQKKQIAVMKAVGASKMQILGMYSVFVLMINGLASAAAIFVANFAAKGLVNFIKDILNFTVSSNKNSPIIYLTELVIGLLLPLTAALFPIGRVIACTVNETLHETGIRNTKRRKGVALATLALAGVSLLISINVRQSLVHTFDLSYEEMKYNTQYILSKDYDIQDVKASLEKINEVESVEYFSGGMGCLKNNDGTISNSFQVIAAPEKVTSFSTQTVEGRWPENGSEEVVMTQSLYLDEGEPEIGDKLNLVIKGKTEEVKLVGIKREIGADNRIYLSQDFYNHKYGETDQIRICNISLKNMTDVTQINRNIEKQLEKDQIDVLQSITSKQTRKNMDNHLVTVSTSLIVISLLMLSIGILSLITATSIELIERKREFGIMRAIGASGWAIYHKVMIEEVFSNLLCWLATLIGAAFLSGLVGDIFGNIFIETYLDNVFVYLAVGVWLLLATVISIITNCTMVTGVMKLPVRETLEYE